MAIKKKSKKKTRKVQAKKRDVKKSSKIRRKKIAAPKVALKSTKRQVAKTKKIVKKAKAKSGGRRKLPALKLKPGKARVAAKRRKKAIAKRKPKAPAKFRTRVIHGQGGDLVKIIHPIGYRDYLRGLKRLEKSEQYRKLKRDYPNVTYSIFGHPGYHTFPSLEIMEAFFTTVYAPTLKALEENPKKRGEFFANLVIYGIKRRYKPAPRSKANHGRKRRKKTRRRL